jgi:hypothetical protein
VLQDVQQRLLLLLLLGQHCLQQLLVVLGLLSQRVWQASQAYCSPHV